LTTLSIIIPSFNESKTLGPLLDKILAVDLKNSLDREIIIIDDCSTDETSAIIHQYISSHRSDRIIQFRRSKNQGKGAAIRTGLAMATGEFVIIQDADLELDPSDYNILLEPILSDEADVVYGSRFLLESQETQFSFHRWINGLLTSLSNARTGLSLTDMETCYKVFRINCIKLIELKEDRFGFEPEITAKIAKLPGIRIRELGISYTRRSYAEGKKIGWKDGIRALYCILRY